MLPTSAQRVSGYTYPRSELASSPSHILASQDLPYDATEEGLLIAYSSSGDVPARISSIPVAGAHVIAQGIGPCDC
jgi:hypothetical protein